MTIFSGKIVRCKSLDKNKIVDYYNFKLKAQERKFEVSQKYHQQFQSVFKFIYNNSAKAVISKFNNHLVNVIMKINDKMLKR